MVQEVQVSNIFLVDQTVFEIDVAVEIVVLQGRYFVPQVLTTRTRDLFNCDLENHIAQEFKESAILVD